MEKMEWLLFSSMVFLWKNISGPDAAKRENVGVVISMVFDDRIQAAIIIIINRRYKMIHETGGQYACALKKQMILNT